MITLIIVLCFWQIWQIMITGIMQLVHNLSGYKLTTSKCKQIVHLDLKGCICHFSKWQIHPFISKGMRWCHLCHEMTKVHLCHEMTKVHLCHEMTKAHMCHEMTKILVMRWRRYICVMRWRRYIFVMTWRRYICVRISLRCRSHGDICETTVAAMATTVAMKWDRTS